MRIVETFAIVAVASVISGTVVLTFEGLELLLGQTVTMLIAGIVVFALAFVFTGIFREK